MNKYHRRAVVIMRLFILAGVVFLAVYVLTYLFQPFSGSWRDLLTNILGILAVVLPASLANIIWRRYQPSDASYPIWMAYALGLWCWVAADTIWAIYNMTVGEVPEVSLADIGYILGYCFVAAALHRQYRILKRPTRRVDVLTTAAIAATIILLTLLISFWIANFVFANVNLGSLLTIFYPIADLGIGVIALVFVINFGHGALARPWLGLTVFAVSDGLYAWSVESGFYAYSVVNTNLPSLLSDTVYVAAYLIVAVFLLNHLLLLKYGPSIVGKFQKTVAP